MLGLQHPCDALKNRKFESLTNNEMRKYAVWQWNHRSWGHSSKVEQQVSTNPRQWHIARTFFLGGLIYALYMVVFSFFGHCVIISKTVMWLYKFGLNILMSIWNFFHYCKIVFFDLVRRMTQVLAGVMVDLQNNFFNIAHHNTDLSNKWFPATASSCTF